MRGLARLLRDDHARGSGFLIAPRHLATCAHVVNLALGRDPRDAERPRPDQIIALAFPDALPDPSSPQPHDRRHTGTVVCWHPPTPEGQAPGPHDDLAVLLLNHPLDSTAVPALAPADAALAAGLSGDAWGCPHGTPDGLWAPAVLSGSSGALRQFNLLGSGPEIQPGFSGGPFTILHQTQIAGMVVQVDEAARAGWLLPLAALRQAWAALRVVELDLWLRDGRLQAGPAGPPAGTPLADLEAAVARGDLAPLRRALFDTADPGQGLADLDALDLGPRRLRLRCRDDAAARLPWHGLPDADGRRLGNQGWVIEVVGPTPRPAVVRSIHNALILAPADARLAPEVRPHVDQVRAALAPLLPHPRLSRVPWAVNCHDLDRYLQDEPDLLYVYAMVDQAGGLALGRDADARESLAPAALLDRLVRLVRRARLPTPPLLWLHCVEADGARLDLDLLLARTRDYPLLLIQRTAAGRVGTSLKRGTLAWLAEFAAAPASEPAAVLSRLGDSGTCVRLGGDGLVLTRPADPDAVLYASIRASLLQLLLGRTTEKDLLAGRIAAPRGGSLLLYFVCGDTQARVHDFPEQGRWHLEALDHPPRVRPKPIPALLGPGQTSEDLLQQLYENLQLNPDTDTTEEALHRLTRPLPGEHLLLSLACLLVPAPDCTPDQIPGWLGRWRQAVLQVFEAREIPAGCRVLAGCCLQWKVGWPEDHRSTATAIQTDAVAVLGRDNPPHCDWVRFEQPLDRLRQDELDDFFRNEEGRLAAAVVGLERRALVDWVWARTAGRFEPTVDTIYRAYKTGFQALRNGDPCPP